MAVLTLMIVLLLCGAAFAWFLQLERDGRPLVVLVFLVWLLVVESILYYSPNLVLIGLFHPEVGGLSFRLFDLLVPAAVVARMLSGRPQQGSGSCAATTCSTSPSRPSSGSTWP